MADKFLPILKLCSRGIVPDFFLIFLNLGIDFNAISVYTLITGKRKIKQKGGR